MTYGPSLASVLQLNQGEVKRSAAPLPAPPLQRPSKAHMKAPVPTSSHDCLETHVAQIEQRQTERIKAMQTAKREHEEDMVVLKGRVAASHEEQASRRSWHRQIAGEQLIQTAEKRAAELQDYKATHSPIEYWPYGADKPGYVIPEKKVYGAELLLAAQQKANAKELTKLAERLGQGTSIRLRVEREREHAQREADTATLLPPHLVKKSLAEADQRRREIVAAMAESRKDQAAGSLDPLGEKYFGDVHATRYQLQEAQRQLREASNKQQLRNVLHTQMAEKRVRELKQHAHIYGKAPDHESTLNRMMAGSSKKLSKEAREQQGTARRRELEAAIAQKQRERRELKKAMTQEQKRLDDTAAETEQLLEQRARTKQAEQRIQLQIDKAQEDSRARRVEAAASQAQG